MRHQHEETVGELEGQNASLMGRGIAMLCFLAGVAFAVRASLWRWLKWKRVCAWHKPKKKRVGGSPLAWRATHTICPDCIGKVVMK